MRCGRRCTVLRIVLASGAGFTTRRVGTTARAFLETLAAARATGKAELREAIAEGRCAFLAEHLPEDAPDQAWTVALHFALVAVAGGMAADMGVLPWPAGKASALAGLAAWLADQGGTGSGEDTAALVAVRTFIARSATAAPSLEICIPKSAPTPARRPHAQVIRACRQMVPKQERIVHDEFFRLGGHAPPFPQ